MPIDNNAKRQPRSCQGKRGADSSLHSRRRTTKAAKKAREKSISNENQQLGTSLTRFLTGGTTQRNIGPAQERENEESNHNNEEDCGEEQNSNRDEHIAIHDETTHRINDRSSQSSNGEMRHNGNIPGETVATSNDGLIPAVDDGSAVAHSTATNTSHITGEGDIQQNSSRNLTRPVIVDDSEYNEDPMPHYHLTGEDEEIHDPDDADDDYDDDGASEGCDTHDPESIMGKYLKCIQDRLKKELETSTSSTLRWLIPWLKQNSWWIRGNKAREICRRLNLPCHPHLAYYCDVRIWLPDIEFGIMPPCINEECEGHCSGQTRIGNYGFARNHVARRITGMKRQYFVMTRRYVCYNCKDAGISNWSYRGWHRKSVEKLGPLALKFPAFLLHASGFDIDLLDQLRAFTSKSVRPDGFAQVVKELHMKTYERQAILQEYENKKLKAHGLMFEQFSSFFDKSFYDGKTPIGTTYERLYARHHTTIRSFLENETKKRELDRLYIDASFKVTKKMGKYHGRKVFDGIILCQNSVQENRSWWAVGRDGIDQYREPFRCMKETMKEYGHAGPRLVICDDPYGFKQFALDTFESVKMEQKRLDASSSSSVNHSSQRLFATPNSQSASTDSHVTLSDTYLEQYVHEHKGRTNINDAAISILGTVAELSESLRVIGLDAEWQVLRNSHNNITGAGKIDLLQLAFRVELHGPIHVHIFHFSGIKNNVPRSIVNLLKDQQLIFVGCQIRGDISKLARDYPSAYRDVTKARTEDVAMLARRRGISPKGGSFGEKGLCDAVLNECLDKSMQTSNWSNKILTKEQITYAALDAMKGLEIYEKIKDLPDLTIPLLITDALPHVEVDVAPSKGTIAHTGLLLARGTVLERPLLYSPPTGFHITNQHRNDLGSKAVVVKINEVLAPSTIIPGMKKGRRFAKLSDFGNEPFELPLPLSMIRSKVEDRKQYAHTRGIDVPPIESVVAAMKTDNIVFDANTSNLNSPILNNEHNDVFGNVGHADYDDDDESIDDQPSSSAIPRSSCDYERQLQQDMIKLSTNAIVDIEECLRWVVTTPGRKWTTPAGADLDPVPESITDMLSSVLRDAFHVPHRFNVNVSHEDCKAFYIAFTEAWFAWNPIRMKKIEDALQKSGLTMNEIKARRYYNISWFLSLCDRIVLPPSLLYYRVRAVFEKYGIRVSRCTGKPLFNKRQWSIARNILKEILLGLYSDPPGHSFYRYQLKLDSTVKLNSLGIEMLICTRGTPGVENTHKHMSDLFGGWPIGFEMGDALLAEFMLRQTIKASEKGRPGYPRLGHYDTWLVDLHQNLKEEVHGALLYPGHQNTSNFGNTSETFGIIPIASQELREKINLIQLPEDFKLSKNLQYLASRTGTKVPCLPWYGKSEWKLFPTLLLKHSELRENELSFDNHISELILDYVDGENIYPKIPTYNRAQRKQFEKNINIRESFEEMKSSQLALDVINCATLQDCSSADSATADEAQNPLSSNTNEIHDAHSTTSDSENTTSPRIHKKDTVSTIKFPDPVRPSPFIVPASVFDSSANLGEIFVGGVQINNTNSNTSKSREKGDRGKDRLKRKVRTCKKCFESAQTCPGGRSGKTYKGGSDVWCKTYGSRVLAGLPIPK